MPFPVELTSDQLELLHSDGTEQRAYYSSEFVVFGSNRVVFKALVNGAPASSSSYAQITFDGVTVGAYADILANQVVLIGVDSDIRKATFTGRVRRNGAGVVSTSTILYVNETSSVIPDNANIWVLNDFRLFDRLSRQVGLVQYSDYDISYSLPAPYITGLQSGYGNVVSGSPVGYTQAFAPTGNPIASGATINNSTWVWNFPTATGTVTYTVGSSTSQNPTVRFGSGYSDWATVQVTDSNGKVGYFHFYVAAIPANWSSVITPALTGANIETNENGWNGSLDAFDGVDELLDNTFCMVLDIEYYQDVEAYITSRVKFIGRIRKENNQTTSDPDYTRLEQATYDLEGPISQFSRVEHLPFTMRLVAGTPTVFDTMQNLSIWRGIAYSLCWRSTFLELFALSFDSTDNTFLYPLLPTQGGNILAIIQDLAVSINAVLQIAPTGEAQIVRDATYLSTAQRNALETVADFDTQQDAIDFTLELEEVDTTGRIQAYGGYYNPLSGIVTALLSLAPGVAQAIGADTPTFSRNVLSATSNQAVAKAELNTRAGNEYELKRRANPLLTAVLPDGYNFITPSANQWYTWTIAASENTGGRAYTTADRWLCIGGSQQHDGGAGTKAIQYTFRLESQGTPGQNIVLPAPDEVNPALPIIPPLPAYPSFPPLPPIYMPPIPTPDDTPPYTPPAPIANGNIVGVISDIQAWNTYNLLLTSTPAYQEITPDPFDGLEMTCFQWVGLGFNGAYALGNDGTDSVFFYTADGTVPSPIWTTTNLTGVYTVIRPTSTAGGVYVLGRQLTSNPADLWELVDGTHGTITSRTDTEIVVEATETIPGTWYAILMTAGDDICSVITDIDETQASSEFYNDCGEPFNLGSPHPVSSLPICARMIEVLTNGGANTVTFTFASDGSCGDEATNYNTVYSTDYGTTFASPEIIAAPTTCMDTVKVGKVALVGAAGQVYKADDGGAYSAYGDPLPADFIPSAIWIPFYEFGSISVANDSADPDYVIVSSALDTDDESMYLVTDAGTTFNAITPIVSAVKGLGVSPDCISMPFKSGKRMACVLNFSGTRKLITSIDIGTGDTFTSRGAVASGARSVRFRRGDLTLSQLAIGDGATGVLVSQNLGATLQTKPNPGEDAILLVEFFG